MKVSTSLTNRHSEDDFAAKLQVLADSGAGVIHIRATEVLRALLATRKAVLLDNNVYHEWNVADGFRTFTVGDMNKIDVQGDRNVDIHACIARPGSDVKEHEDDEFYTFYTFVNPQFWLDNNPVTTHFLQTYCHMLSSSNIRVLLITPDVPLPEELSDTIVTLQFDPPAHQELMAYLESVLSGVDESVVSLTEEEKERICYAGAGMSRENFEMYVSLAIVDAASDEDRTADFEAVMQGLNDGKTEVVNKNDILELYKPEDMTDVGGMENLKEWVAKRTTCYTDEAKAFGITPPKGLVLLGIPGTGKSLAAKAISNELGVPLVRLDFGRVFNSLVGQSEERMRTALRMVEAMAPVCLFCVDGKTLVRLSDGSSIAAEAVYREHLHGRAFTLQGMDPATGGLQDLPMSTIIRTQGKPMVRVSTESGKSIEVTTDHRLLVQREGEKVWVAASALKEGDDLVEVDR